MGSLPADSEQIFLIEDFINQTRKTNRNQEMNMTNKVNIEFLQRTSRKIIRYVEKLKDANREMEIYKW